MTTHEMSYGEDYKFIPATSLRSGDGTEVRPDVYSYTIQIVNLGLIGDPATGEYVMVDTGMPRSVDDVHKAITGRFGSLVPPTAIVLTHGHFDHVGTVIELVEQWQVPVYAHELEMPFLTGQEAYPKPDSSVEGGLLAKVAFIYPREPINIGSHVRPLPADGSIPGLPDWRWIHTPGHSRGHVSLFRDSDRTMLPGDAFITVKQDSLYKVLIQEPEVCGPPVYLTPDWAAAWESVRKLAAMQPEAALTGHGVPLFGEVLRSGLDNLARNFDTLAIPDHGRYVDQTHD
jgi:glyoxylase-like metal-dependent hydrolase (beta-lactamase superfamily II)